VAAEIRKMLAERRLEALAPQALGEPDGYYLDLDGTRLMLQTILRQI
jgi:hypothetical protein